MKADGIPTEDNEDLAADMRRAKLLIRVLQKMGRKFVAEEKDNATTLTYQLYTLSIIKDALSL